MPTTAHLFAGGGGDTEGAIAAGYTPLWSVQYEPGEKQQWAATIYRKRFPDTQLIEQDITKLTGEFIQSLPVPDALIWGSPCPDFSQAGNRAGIEGDRGKLFFEGVRFLRLLQPDFFVFENVRGLFSSGEGEDFKQVIQAFAEVGYMGTWQLKNGNRHVPQNRPRVFCLGVHWRCASNINDALQEVAG